MFVHWACWCIMQMIMQILVHKIHLIWIFKKIKETKYDGTIRTGGRSGGSRPLEGQPNTYVNTESGHKLVYGADGRLNLDISTKRVKARGYDIAPNGHLYPRDMNLIGPVPRELLENR